MRVDPGLLRRLRMWREDCPGCAHGPTRRDFCAGAGAGLLVLGLAGCEGGPARISTGAIDDAPGGGGGGGGDSPDMARGNIGGGGGGGGGGSPDLAQAGGGGSTDLAQAATTCAGTLNAGAASAIAVGTAKHFSSAQYDLYVCRDAGGLFTVDSACTHSGCVVKLQSGHWYCPCHGARFNFDGTGATSPAFSPLPNYAVCVDAGGNVTVDYANTVSPSTRA
jgi:nitrite reductase/ring-hydroxylating ferredoxin subunit